MNLIASIDQIFNVLTAATVKPETSKIASFGVFLLEVDLL
jgi:hypothetical protein